MDTTNIHVILASARSGKSTLASNIVSTYIKGKKKMPKVYMFSYPGVQCNFLDPDFIYEFDINTLEEIIEKPFEKIIILEDLMSQTTPADLKFIDRKLSLHRHKMTHFIIINQSYKTLSPALRTREISTNITLYLCKQKQNRMKDIFESLDAFETYEDYNQVNKELEQYEFLKINPDNTYEIVKADPTKELKIMKREKK